MSAPKKTLADLMTDIIREYHQLKTDTPDIIVLLNMRQKLSTLSVGFARELGELYMEKNGAESRRKATEAKKHIELVMSGESSAKAAQMAREACEELYKDEALTDGVYRSAQVLLSQVNAVLDCMNQHAAFLRAEYRTEGSRQNQTV